MQLFCHAFDNVSFLFRRVRASLVIGSRLNCAGPDPDAKYFFCMIRIAIVMPEFTLSFVLDGLFVHVITLPGVADRFRPSMPDEMIRCDNSLSSNNLRTKILRHGDCVSS